MFTSQMHSAAAEHGQAERDPEQGARLDVAVGLLEHLGQVEELGRQPVQERLLVDLLERLLQEHVGRRVPPAAAADELVEPLGRPPLVLVAERRDSSANTIAMTRPPIRMGNSIGLLVRMDMAGYTCGGT